MKQEIAVAAGALGLALAGCGSGTTSTSSSSTTTVTPAIAATSSSAAAVSCRFVKRKWVTVDSAKRPCVPDPAFASGNVKADEKDGPIPRCVHCKMADWNRAERIAASSITTSSSTETTTTTRPPRHRSAQSRPPAIPAGYAGIGVPESLFVRKNTQAPPNPAGVPPGLAWFTVTHTDSAGHVTGFEMTENFQPAAGDRERISLLLGILVPPDIQGTSINGDRCEVVKSAILKRLTGDSYAVASTVTGTKTADLDTESSPGCP